MNIASFNLGFARPFCVVSQSGFKIQEADTLEEAQVIVSATLSPRDITCAIYGAGESNRISIHYWK